MTQINLIELDSKFKSKNKVYRFLFYRSRSPSFSSKEMLDLFCERSASRRQESKVLF